MPLYRATENELDEAFRALDKDAIDVPAGPCTACVGALQHADAAAFLDPVCERLAQEKYESSYVNLTCTIPVCMMHRDHLLSMYICDQLPEEAKAQWKDHAVRDPKDPFKAIWGEKLIERTGLKIDASAPLRMTVVLEHSATASEHLFLTQTKTPVLKIRKVKKSGRTIRLGDSRSSIADALKSLDETEARSLTAVPPLPQTTVAEFSSVELVHESCLVGGRYLKYSREYSQTPWAIRGKKLAENSVSECIGEVLKQHARCDDYKFVPAGREDANVRMLGTGRPFYCELINPRRPVLPMAEYKEMENEVNALPSKDDVQVQQLVQVQSKHTKIIKEGEQFKRKTYRALVWVSEPLDDAMISRVNVAGSVPFHIKQGTPIRVFQRRAAAVREKEIHYCTIERVPEDQHLAILTLNTQAGTYIKEFVHGDLGRTVPNLASIAGVKAADLLDLDVLEVDLEWPPRMIDG
ncbi:putative tRNA pseudouridine synthase Pus10 [Apophysomyces sp. BC1034]|nr:putative tRNA pseudouridine synthase Pus10 [Apophysomyces sp. BC1034]